MSGRADSPLVSVCIPTYNCGRFLGECLRSVQAQTYTNLEILIGDNASTDETRQIVDAIADPRISYFRHATNLGQFSNVNWLIGRAAGEFIAVYHADDIYEPGIVEREAAYLQRYPEAGVVFCLDTFMNAQGGEYGRLSIPPEVQGGRPLDYPVIFNAMLTHKNSFLPNPSSMVRSSVYRDVGPYRGEEFGDHADVEMWLRVARKHCIGIIEEHLFRYRHRPDSAFQQSRYLRTEPARVFQIIDMELAGGGGAWAQPEALRAYEAHRAEDRLLCTVSLYIRDEREAGRRLLRQVQVRRLLGSSRVQRGRLLVLFGLLYVLLRLPRISWMADLFYRRWHVQGGSSLLLRRSHASP